MKEIVMVVSKEFEKDADNLINQIEELGTKVHKRVLEEDEFKEYMLSRSCDKAKTDEVIFKVRCADR